MALEAADVTLMRNDPRGVATAIGLSKATMMTVRQNLFWAFFYNVALIPVAAGVLYPIFSRTGVPEGWGFFFGDYGFLNPMLAGYLTVRDCKAAVARMPMKQRLDWPGFVDEYRHNVEKYQDQLAEQRRKRAEKAKAQAAAEARRRSNLRAVGS